MTTRAELDALREFVQRASGFFYKDEPDKLTALRNAAQHLLECDRVLHELLRVERLCYATHAKEIENAWDAARALIGSE